MEHKNNRIVLWVVLGVLALAMVCTLGVLVGGATAYLLAARADAGPAPWPTAQWMPEERVPVIPDVPRTVVPSMPLMSSYALVTAVTPDSPAEDAGIQAGDMIVRFDDQTLRANRGPADVIASYEPGDVVIVTVRRDSGLRDLRVTLGEHPDDASRPWLGITYQLVQGDGNDFRDWQGD